MGEKRQRRLSLSFAVVVLQSNWEAVYMVEQQDLSLINHTCCPGEKHRGSYMPCLQAGKAKKNKKQRDCDHGKGKGCSRGMKVKLKWKPTEGNTETRLHPAQLVKMVGRGVTGQGKGERGRKVWKKRSPRTIPSARLSWSRLAATAPVSDTRTCACAHMRLRFVAWNQDVSGSSCEL